MRVLPAQPMTTVTISVPSIACGGCIQTLTTAIHTVDQTAIVQGDVANKTITVTTAKPMSDIKAVIIATGHQIAE